MSVKEVIEQLKSLREHCKEYADAQDEDCIWKKDVQALDIAIEILEDMFDEEED